jgi:hypothetical protein
VLELLGAPARAGIVEVLMSGETGPAAVLPYLLTLR